MTTLDYLEQVDGTLAHLEDYLHGPDGDSVTKVRRCLCKVRDQLVLTEGRRPCHLKDKNGDEIHFGDKLRFADKVEWYRGKYWAKVAVGTITKDAALKEIDSLPYEERVVEGVEDYDWLLSSDREVYWEIVKQEETA